MHRTDAGSRAGMALRSQRRRMIGTLAGTAALATALAAPGGAFAQKPKVVADKLDGPRQIQVDRGRLYVVEGDAGRVATFNLRTGSRRADAVKGLPLLSGVDLYRGRFFLATGGPQGPQAAPEGAVPTALLRAAAGDDAKRLTNFNAAERKYNPDRQVQFVDGKPVDTLTNPYAVAVSPDTGTAYVSDGGANTVWTRTRKGKVRPFFTPPVITDGACAGAENNPGTTGCDPVPTGITFGPDGFLYVATLGAEVPNAARIYKVHPRTGKVRRTIGGLTGLTGVAVDPRGNVYASELFYNAPPLGEQGPPPGFDPSTVGRVVRISPNGTKKTTSVTMPTGLEWHAGRLYASAWSVASFLGIQDAGQVVTVKRSAFTGKY